jgi:EmrB/QacA subfamily drug resistance transporter
MSDVRTMADRRTGSRPEARRWLGLAVISVAQLMVALDATIMNIALPSAQHALGVTDADRQWVITAYTLALAGLLLLGGRVADYLGRKRAFLIGLAGFAAGSAIGGAAVNLGMLVVGRAMQGAFAAILVPTALSLIAVTFTEPKERGKAFAVYGAIASSGGAVGLLLGGALTQYSSWRWCMYVNVVIGLLAALAGLAYLVEAKVEGRPRFDMLGVLLVTGGLVSVVYACSQAVTAGWGATRVVGLLVAGAVLLALFVLWEARTSAPLLPLHILWNRSRGGTCIAAGCAVIGMLGMFLLLTYYFQVVLGYPPLKAGLAFLPLTVAIAASAFGIASPLLPRVAPRLLMVPGLLVTAAGLLVLTQLEVGSSYLTHTLPAEILLGAGLGCVVTPAFSVATQGVDRRETGVAAATVNTAQQVGGSLGVALLNTLAASATVAYLAGSGNRGGDTVARALVHGYTTAIGWAAGIVLFGAVIAALLIDAPRPAPHGDGQGGQQDGTRRTPVRTESARTATGKESS